MEKNKEVKRFIKFTLFSASAGVVQFVSFTILNEVCKLVYWPAYLIALTLSVLWNFTINRKFTFKSANNVALAMTKVALYYVAFTPLSTWGGDALVGIGWNEYLVLILTMLINFTTEFLFTRFVVYGKSVDTKIKTEKKKKTVKNDIDVEKVEEVKDIALTDEEPVKETPKIIVDYCSREPFSIIGKVIYYDETKTMASIEELWNEAGTHFHEVVALTKKDEKGNAVGFWGAMSDATMSFLPWKDFKEGYYMAGVEVIDSARAPKGWKKWTIPAFDYLYAKVENNYQEVFDYIINDYIPQNNMILVGAIQEYNCPEENGQLYLFFPIEKK